MYVTKQTIKPFTVGFFTLTYNQEKDLAVSASIVLDGAAVIESDDLKLTLNLSTENGRVGEQFILRDKVFGEERPLTFDIRYW